LPVKLSSLSLLDLRLSANSTPNFITRTPNLENRTAFDKIFNAWRKLIKFDENIMPLFFVTLFAGHIMYAYIDQVDILFLRDEQGG